MYVITDSYGTKQTAWTWAGAVAWLPFCAPRAEIRNRLTGRFVAGR